MMTGLEMVDSGDAEIFIANEHENEIILDENI